MGLAKSKVIAKKSTQKNNLKNNKLNKLKDNKAKKSESKDKLKAKSTNLKAVSNSKKLAVKEVKKDNKNKGLNKTAPAKGPKIAEEHFKKESKTFIAAPKVIDSKNQTVSNKTIAPQVPAAAEPIKKLAPVKTLTKEQLSLCKKKLLEMRNAIFYKDYAIKEFTIDKNELSDVLDEATINDLMSKEVRLRNREIFHLKKINKGLEMIQRGTYGVCHDCDELIPFERLIVRPETDMCISCKEASENEELRNINEKLPKSQGLSMEQVLGR